MKTSQFVRIDKRLHNLKESISWSKRIRHLRLEMKDRGDYLFRAYEGDNDLLCRKRDRIKSTQETRKRLGRGAGYDEVQTVQLEIGIEVRSIGIWNLARVTIVVVVNLDERR